MWAVVDDVDCVWEMFDRYDEAKIYIRDYFEHTASQAPKDLALSTVARVLIQIAPEQAAKILTAMLDEAGWDKLTASQVAHAACADERSE